MKPDHDRIKHLLTQSVTSLCKSVLQYRKKIQGRLEITVDDDERFVVHINEVAGGNPTPSHLNGAMRHDQQLRQPPGLGPSGFGDDSYGSLAQNNFLLPFSFGSGAGNNNNPHYAALNLTSADYPTIGFWPQDHPPHSGLPQSSCQMSNQVDRTYHVHVHVNSSNYMDNQQPPMNQFSDLLPNDSNADGGQSQQQQHGGAAASAAQKIVARSKKTFGKTFGSSMTAAAGGIGKKKPRSKSKGGSGCQCKVCGKVLAYSNHMAAHMRTHTGEKPYVCTVCNKAFNRTFNLQEHMRVHTGERPYPCTMCDKSFKLANALAKHVLVHSDERPFVCSVCNKAYKQACELKHHLLIHTGEKPYVCDQCGKSFRWAHCLSRHKAEVVHPPREDSAGEGTSGGASGTKTTTPSRGNGRGGGTHPDKMYTCTVCNKSFMQTSRLITHMLSHTDHRPHLCTVCGKSFKYLNNLVEHMKTKRHTSEMAAAADGGTTTLVTEEVNNSGSNGNGDVVGDINQSTASDLGEVNLSVSAALEVAVGD